MAAEWMSALPSAWKPQDPNTQVQAAKLGAETAVANVQAASTAVDAATKNQDRIRKQALQDVMGQAIKTRLGPDGQPVHEFDNNTFLGLLKSNPAAADAYAMWSEKINPANATVSTQRAMAGNTTAEGGLDAAGMSKAAQGSEYAGQILAAGRGIQQAQATTGTNVAANRFAQNQLGTGTTAQPGSLLYNEQVQPKSVETPTSNTGTGTITADDISQLSKAGRESALYNLRAKGVVLPATASAADIAAAANGVADAEVARQSVAGADLDKPVSLATSAFQAAGSAPSTRNKVYGDIFGNALDYKSKQIGIAGGELDVQNAQNTQKQIDSFRAQGYAANKSNIDDVVNTSTAVNWLKSTRESVRDYKRKVATGDINKDTFNNIFNTWLNAPQSAEGLSTESGRSAFLSGLRPSKSFGALIKDAPPQEALSRIFANATSAQSQLEVLNQLEGMLVEQLHSGKAVTHDKQLRQLPGSSFPKPGAKASKADPLGIRK